ncbi:Sodium:sulfate symporter transmembrane region-domain-containing protein [Dichotomocladium elegans]|nr:Sodium:sulfate symporter transmembrane region-domain-containing protein [Dichotomocladium elegans]
MTSINLPARVEYHTFDSDNTNRDQPTQHRSNDKSSGPQAIWNAIYQSQTVSLAPSFVVGALIWFCTPISEELTLTSVHLLAVFVSCIFALITTSVDISALVLTGLAVLSVTKSFQCEDAATGLSTECRLCGTSNPLNGKPYECNGAKDAFRASLDGFSSSVVWLIFAAFHLGKAVEVTQLGRRVSLLMIKLFGKRIMGLAYAIVLSEILLGPFVPSNTARGGGIVHPVVNSIATTLGSSPSHDPQVGAFLMLVGSHSNLLSASMYLTGMAANPIVVARVAQLYPEINFDFMTWLKGSIVPVAVCAATLPIILYWSCGLSSKSRNDEERARDSNTIGKHVPCSTSNNIVQHAEKELERMGSMTLKEWQLCLILMICLCLWVTSSYTKLDATLVALIGIVALLHTATLKWKDISKNTNAWDTLFWLGGFVTMAQQLSNAGASAFLGHKISSLIEHLGLPPVPLLAIAYFLTTFMFSSLSAHIVAFVGTFLDAGHALGAEPMLIAAFLAYFGALGGCMASGNAIICIQAYILILVGAGAVWGSHRQITRRDHQPCILHRVTYRAANGSWWGLKWPCFIWSSILRSAWAGGVFWAGGTKPQSYVPSHSIPHSIAPYPSP